MNAPEVKAIELAEKLVEVAGSLPENLLQGDEGLDYRARPAIGGASITFLTPSGIHTRMIESIQLLEVDAHPFHRLWEVKRRLHEVLLAFYHELQA